MEENMKKGILIVFSTVIGFVAGKTLNNILIKNTENKQKEKTEKFRCYYNILLEWLSIKQKGELIELYFIKHNYNTIAVYGMGELGNRLINELHESDIKVAYAIDKNEACVYPEIEIKEPGEPVDDVDAVIVTPIWNFDEIKEVLEGYMNCPIISLENVIYENK